ncbi:MAG: hypothetical protein HPY83_13955 [Anaerolineae bacterium]|nr:hypothetical protein [Anaerolineae bacterium]
MKASWGRVVFCLAWMIVCLLLWPLGALAQESVADISSPQPGATVREIVVVTGTALHPRFSFYKVEYAVEPGSNWVVIGDTRPTQVRDGVLVEWNTRAVPDGSYSLRLVVVDETGNYIEDVVRQVVVANTAPAETETPTVTGTPPEVLTATAEAGPTLTPTPVPPTPTVVIELPSVGSPTVAATSTSSLTAGPTALPTTADPRQGTGDAVVELVTGAISEVVEATGISSAFRGVGSAVVNGALVAVGAFAVVGVLALVRQLALTLYHMMVRR